MPAGTRCRPVTPSYTPQNTPVPTVDPCAHLEGCQQCYRTSYYLKHGKNPPTFEFYKDGKDYLKSLRNVLSLLDGYMELVDECEVAEKRARGKRRRLNPYMDMDRYNCANMLRAGKLD